MQRDAEQRVRNMQDRARKYVDSTPGEFKMVSPPPLSIHHEPEPVIAAEHCAPENGLSALFGDKDRMLLLLLAVLLVKSGARMELIIALLYLAL